MADEGQDRTEEPTLRRREEARKQGQIAFSPDLVGSAVLLAGVIGLRVLGPGMAIGFQELLRERLLRRIPAELTVSEVADLVNGLMSFFLRQVSPFMLVLTVVGVAACVVQVGFQITPERLELKPERLNPAEGFGRVFSVAGLVKGLLALVRVAVLFVLVLVVLRSRVGVFSAVSQADVGTAAGLAWELAMRLALYLAIAFFVIGVVDYVYQRYRFEQSLKMSRQELKEELKREEGDPLIKARMRQLGREMARRRMLAEVPTSTVVITNPTHYAIALRYIQGTMRSPKVVAKGAGVLAERIKEAARRHGVPILERPALARALYRAVALEKEIPPGMFVAVAEVIAFVHRLRNPDGHGAGRSERHSRGTG